VSADATTAAKTGETTEETDETTGATAAELGYGPAERETGPAALTPKARRHRARRSPEQNPAITTRYAVHRWPGSTL